MKDGIINHGKKIAEDFRRNRVKGKEKMNGVISPKAKALAKMKK